MPKKIIIAGYYGFKNIGDELILSAMVRNIRSVYPDVDICVIAGDVALINKIHDVRAIPWDGIRQIIDEIANCAAVILGGGGLFHDYWGTDQASILTTRHIGISFYSSIALLASILEKPLMLYSVGIGPLFTREGKECVKAIAEQARIISVRDDASKAELVSLGIPAKRIRVTADAAFLGLTELEPGSAPSENGLGHPLVGVSLRHWDVGVDGKLWPIEVAAALDAFLDENPTAEILFVPFQTQKDEFLNDTAISKLVRKSMRNRLRTELLENIITPEGVDQAIARCDLVMGMRLHALALAAIHAKPMVGLVYDPKVSILLTKLSLAEYAIPLPELDRARLLKLLRAAHNKQARLSKIIHQKSAHLISQAVSVNDLVAQLMVAPAAPAAHSPHAAGLLQKNALLTLSVELEHQTRDNRELSNDYVKLQRLLEKTINKFTQESNANKNEIEQLKQEIVAIQVENEDLQQKIHTIDLSKEQMEKALQEKITAQSDELTLIKQSRAWKLIWFFWQVRLFFIPKGSKREQIFAVVIPKNKASSSRVQKSRQFLGRILRGLQPWISRYAYAFYLYRHQRDARIPFTGSRFFTPHQPGLVSIVLPVYNGADYLPEALESIIAQTYTNFEVIAVDDGSTDATSGILANFARRDHRIRVITQKNIKLPGALANGFSHANGEFLTWISHDNRFKPDFLAKMVNDLKRHPNWDMAYANMDLIGENGEPLKNSAWYAGYQSPPGSEHIHLPRRTAELNTWPNNFIGGAFMYRNSVRDMLPGYSPHQFTREDYDLWMQVNSLLTLRHTRFSEPVYDYRFHNQSLTSRDEELNITEDRKYLMIHDDFRRDFALSPLLWVIKEEDAELRTRMASAGIRNTLASRGQVILSLEQVNQLHLPRLFLPVIYLQISANPMSLPAWQPGTDFSVAKALLCVSEGFLPAAPHTGWDFCLALGKNQPPRIQNGVSGWWGSDHLPTLLSALDIAVHAGHARLVEAEVNLPPETKVRLSVIICTYKRDGILEKALQAVAQQTIPLSDYEVIVVDNNPEGSSLSEMIAGLQKNAFKQNPQRLRLVHCPLLGLSHARNAGIAEAAGEILVFLDDDAIAHNDLLEHYLAAYAVHPQAGVIGGHIRLKLPDPVLMVWMHGWEKYWSQFLTGFTQYTPVQQWWEFPWGANWSAPRTALMQIGGFRTRYGRCGEDFNGGEEIIAASLIQKLGYEIAVLPQAEVLHCVEPARFTLQHMKHTIKAGLFVHYQAQRDLYLPIESSLRQNANQVLHYLQAMVDHIVHPHDPVKRALSLERSFHLGARVQLLLKQVKDRLLRIGYRIIGT